MTLSLFPSLSQRSERVALTVDATRLSYASLAQACGSHLRALERAGVVVGDRVAVLAQHHVSTAIALVAHAHAGIVSVPMHPTLGERERAAVLANARPRFIVAADVGAGAAMRSEWAVIPIDTATACELPPAAGSVDDPALVVYTSGTTGAPKGAVLTRGNLASNLDALARTWSWTESDVLVHALPLFHVHGLCFGLFGALRVGASLRWHTRFSATEVVAEFDRGATMLFGVPTMYHRLCEAMTLEPSLGKVLGRARVLVSGSAPLPAREHARIEALTGQRPLERYGMTETLINCAQSADGPRRPGEVGPALAGVELRLVDDARVTLAQRDASVMGELAVRGPNVFQGYLDRPEATQAVLDRDGWFYTGDMATMASDGSVRIVGRRATDLIKTGGFKVGAGEVEGALLEHPAVAEAAVIGEPDDDLGERIVAFVVLRAAVEPSMLVDHVAGLLVPHKRPRIVRVLGELPRNAMGKVNKKVLRAVGGT